MPPPGLQEQPRARHLEQLGAQPVDHHPASTGPAARRRLEGDKDVAGLVAWPPAKPPTVATAGSALDDVDELLEFLFHRLEGDALVAADAAEDHAVVGIGEKALGHDGQKIEIQSPPR